jgi:hypothetical protein
VALGAGRRPARPATTPARIQVLLVFLLLASLAWGALGAWTVLGHGSAASSVVAVSEPLSLDAQQLYQSLSDADATATGSFLAGPREPLAAREHYAADIARAATDLSRLKDATGGAADPRLAASLAAVSTGLPVYTGEVAQAQTEDALGYLLTGGSFIQVSSEEMHLTLLPAARSVYARQNAALTAQTAQATGRPWLAVVAAAAIALGAVLIRAQRWLTRRTHRVLNGGLVVATAALAVATVWLAAAFAVARSDLGHATGRGSAPAELLAQAAIDAQQARGDEVLTLISRSGDGPFAADYRALRGRLGPGPGTLLTTAAQAAPGGAGTGAARAAGREAAAWYRVNDQAYRLDAAAGYAAETQLVIGSGPAGSAARFGRVEADIQRAVAADQVTFDASAGAGRDAYAGLAAGLIAAAVLMAAASTWGLARRLSEYR